MLKLTPLEQAVYELAEPIVTSIGIELVDVKYAKVDGRLTLSIIIDKKGGIDIDDCSTVSLAVEPVLDERDIIKAEYDLEVSSPGLDRPITTTRDLERNIGGLLEIDLFTHQDKKLKFEGILKSYDEQQIVIILDEPFIKGVKPKTNGQERIFRRSDIKLLKKAIRF
jgi:ribosome maturation factor RimP